MDKNYLVYHCHTDLSNPTTTLDSVTKFTDYVDRAKELNMKAICFTEHGNIMDWVGKKIYCDEKNIKYIHGIEMYVTKTLNKNELKTTKEKILFPKIKDGILTFNKKDLDVEDITEMFILDCCGKTKKEIKFKMENSTPQIIQKALYNYENDNYYVNDYDFNGIVALKLIYQDSKNVRDNYHVVMISKNYEGVKELNLLSSLAFNRADVKVVDNIERFYYNPRITYQELKNTSDNIIICTACLGGILNSDDSDLENDFIEFLSNNNHRCFLEIQHHYNSEEQKKYNLKLLNLSNKHNIKLISGTDTHALNDEHLKARSIMQKAKNSFYDNENNWDLTFKSYNELVDAYKKQDCLPENIFLDSINNTNILCDMVEEFELDTSNKYPKLHDNTEEIFYEKIKEGSKRRNIDLNNEEYKNRIDYEISVVKKQGALDLFLLEEKVKKHAREERINYGWSRGSASGSELLFLLGATEIDSIRYDLNFERFMSPERISLADIDSDWSPNKREQIKKFVHNIEGLQCSEIITFMTAADKGSIRDVGRALEMPLNEIDAICKQIPDDKNKSKLIIEKLEKEYLELFYYVNIIKGTITAMGTHAAATIVYDHSLQELIGTCSSTTCIFPISQISMKYVDFLNLVKLDILGLDTVDLIFDTCELSGIPPIDPNIMDFNEEKVWQSIHESKIGIFQFTQTSSWIYLCKLFSKETMEKMKLEGGDIDYLYLASIATGAIRPAGSSFRNKLASGEFEKRGHIALDDFLSKTRGQLVFQETIIAFLNKFCGYSMGEADVVRRAFSKKKGTDQYIPQIKKGFIETLTTQYNTSLEESEILIEEFIKVIDDASDYLFSLLHALSYTMFTFSCLWLRYYYKIEFLTVLLNIKKDNMEETKEIIEYASKFKINIKSPKFRYSKNGYFYDKKLQNIYKGIDSIKGIGNNLCDYLYSLKNMEFKNFVDFLKFIEEDGTLSKNLSDLICLNFFEEFGNNKKLLTIFEEFKNGKNKYTKKLSDKSKENRLIILNELEESLENQSLPLRQQLDIDNRLLGYIQCTYNIKKRYGYVMELNTDFSPRANIYFLQSGKTQSLKFYKNPPSKWYKGEKYISFKEKPFEVGDIIYATTIREKPKMKLRDDGDPKNKHDWVQSEQETEFWITDYTVNDINL